MNLHQQYLESRIRMYGDELAKQAAYGEAMRIKPATIRQELLGTIAHLKEQLEKKEAMVKLLDANPAIEQFMDLSRG